VRHATWTLKYARPPSASNRNRRKLDGKSNEKRVLLPETCEKAVARDQRNVALAASGRMKRASGRRKPALEADLIQVLSLSEKPRSMAVGTSLHQPDA
jgi:hypothetical protein